MHISVTHALNSRKHSCCKMLVGSSVIRCTEFTGGDNRAVILVSLQEGGKTRKPTIECLAYAAE